MLEVEFLLPTAMTLKEKRSVLRSIRDKVRNSLNVSTAEVGYQDKPGRCHFAAVTIAADKAVAQKRLQDVEEIIEMHPGASVIERQVQWL